MSDESKLSQSKLIQCPRCGYDVAALRPTDWAGKVGTCPECGYGLDWKLIESEGSVEWFIECRTEGWGFWKRWRQTTWRILKIRPFVDQVKLETRFIPRRAFAWALTLFLVLQLVFGIGLVARRLPGYAPPPPPPALPPGITPAMTTWFPTPSEDVGTWLVSNFTMPLFMVEIENRSGWPSSLRWYQFLGYQAPVWNFKIPVGKTLVCTVTVGPGTLIMPVRILWIVIVVMPAVLVCLPWTRRRAKVRMSHVMRASVYSLAAFVPLIFGRLILELITPAAAQSQLSMPGGFFGVSAASHGWMLIALALSVLWMWAWWERILRVHWALPRARAVWGSLVIISGLVIVIMLLISDGAQLLYQWM